ncbi:MAG: hypothetical protein ACD_21C00059G0002 [uncultured bacterium]|nr:MAG: hypothetical protein ACD_21C00059G0002 [uncultured bacterium]
MVPGNVGVPAAEGAPQVQVGAEYIGAEHKRLQREFVEAIRGLNVAAVERLLATEKINVNGRISDYGFQDPQPLFDYVFDYVVGKGEVAVESRNLALNIIDLLLDRPEFDVKRNVAMGWGGNILFSLMKGSMFHVGGDYERYVRHIFERLLRHQTATGFGIVLPYQETGTPESVFPRLYDVYKQVIDQRMTDLARNPEAEIEPFGFNAYTLVASWGDWGNFSHFLNKLTPEQQAQALTTVDGRGRSVLTTLVEEAAAIGYSRESTVEVINGLLHMGLDINGIDGKGDTALTVAIRSAPPGKEGINFVKSLLMSLEKIQGFDINGPLNSDGAHSPKCSPLIVALEEIDEDTPGRADIANMLLKYEGWRSVNIFQSPSPRANVSATREMISVLRRFFHDAKTQADFTELMERIRLFSEPEVFERFFNSDKLNVAASRGCEAVVRQFLKLYPHANIPPDGEPSALMAAVFAYGSPSKETNRELVDSLKSVIRLLVEDRNTDLYHRDKEDQDAFRIALKSESYEYRNELIGLLLDGMHLRSWRFSIPPRDDLRALTDPDGLGAQNLPLSDELKVRVAQMRDACNAKIQELEKRQGTGGAAPAWTRPTDDTAPKPGSST